MHGHIQCTRNTHLLGEVGHAPAMKIFLKSYTLRLLLDNRFLDFARNAMTLTILV